MPIKLALYIKTMPIKLQLCHVLIMLAYIVKHIMAAVNFFSKHLYTSFHDVYISYLFTLCYHAADVQNYETSDGYNNEHSYPFRFTCGGNFNVLRGIESSPRLDRDRQYKFTCRQVNKEGKFDSCSWTEFVADYGESFSFSCPNNQVITGVRSRYTVAVYDRVFRFQCCQKNDFYTRACESTGYLNESNEAFSDQVGGNRVFIGANTYYDDATG